MSKKILIVPYMLPTHSNNNEYRTIEMENSFILHLGSDETQTRKWFDISKVFFVERDAKNWNKNLIVLIPSIVLCLSAIVLYSVLLKIKFMLLSFSSLILICDMFLIIMRVVVKDKDVRFCAFFITLSSLFKFILIILTTFVYKHADYDFRSRCFMEKRTWYLYFDLFLMQMVFISACISLKILKQIFPKKIIHVWIILEAFCYLAIIFFYYLYGVFSGAYFFLFLTAFVALIITTCRVNRYKHDMCLLINCYANIMFLSVIIFLISLIIGQNVTILSGKRMDEFFSVLKNTREQFG